MHVARASDFESFRVAARSLLRDGVTPGSLSWDDPMLPQGGLFANAAQDEHHPQLATSDTLKVPRRYLELAQLAVLVRSPDRFDLAYRLLYRLQREPRLLDDVLDPDLQELVRRSQNVRSDEHRMHAFVRFRRTVVENQETFVAWYEPQHFVLELCAPFFQRRFAVQRWAILTPDGSAHWDGDKLQYGPALARSQAPQDDELESLFRTYYQATFNPARNNPALFQRHVPLAFQRGLPELQGVNSALAAATPAPALERGSEAHGSTLNELATSAAACRACPLGERATQTVFGIGPENAQLCLVGEQPGDEEDQSGEPFVGPAGKVLDRALAEAALDRAQLYVTNAVKHFSFRPDGKKRLHVKPTWSEVQACRPWLEAELRLLRPKVIVCLGATAAQSFLGRRFSIGQNRGRLFETPWADSFLVSYHPSAVLRAVDENTRVELYNALVADLQRARALLPSC